MSAIAWRFVGEAEEPRLLALTQSLPQSALASALRDGLTLRCFHREPREHDHSFRRAVFCGTVDLRLFDWFFNSGTGYRAAFYQGPDIGTRANRTLLDELSEFLLTWAVPQHDEDRSWVHASLSQPSAKAWLAEYPGLCPACAGEWSSSYVSELEIRNDRWEYSPHVHAAWGRQAPSLTKIRIFGGFIDARHHEWLATRKSERAMHISEHGWS